MKGMEHKKNAAHEITADVLRKLDKHIEMQACCYANHAYGMYKRIQLWKTIHMTNF